jgi:hypothetical protein
MNIVPSAVLELLLRYFGTAALPDFSAAIDIIARDPYRPLRGRLTERWSLEDSTDIQYDLGWSWWLGAGSRVVNLRLSFVGPYAVLLNSLGTATIYDDDVLALVRDEGFLVLSREQLEAPVEIWSPEYGGELYEFLFEFDRGTPWNR